MKNDGGPAFPETTEHTRVGFHATVGMTLRDYFAAAALQGLLSDHITIMAASKTKGAIGCWQQLAKDAINIADAMIAEREK